MVNIGLSSFDVKLEITRAYGGEVHWRLRDVAVSVVANGTAWIYNGTTRIDTGLNDEEVTRFIEFLESVNARIKDEVNRNVARLPQSSTHEG